MSRSVRNRGGIDISATLVECDPTELTGREQVHDLDQLSAVDRRLFLDAVERPAPTPEIDAAGLSTGDVVRYTSYYRVV